MDDDRTGSGDPARTLKLLWRARLEPPARRRGPRPGQSADDVVEAAIALADAEGLAAVSMRRVATELGVAPMTLYGYVGGKAELLDGMLDELYARMPRPARRPRTWRRRLERVAAANRALYARHPWAAAIGTSRPPLGPGQLAKYDYELAALDGSGLDDVTRDAALSLLLGFVRANARDAQDAAAAREASGDDETWWAANGPLLEQLVDPEEFPLASRVGTAAGEAQGAALDPDAAYAFGLQRIIDGIVAIVAAP